MARLIAQTRHLVRIYRLDLSIVACSIYTGGDHQSKKLSNIHNQAAILYKEVVGLVKKGLDKRHYNYRYSAHGHMPKQLITENWKENHV